MSSEHFKNNNITNLVSPILLDQITFKIPIYTSAKEEYRKVIRAPDKKGKHQIEVLNDPITSYFADPRLYPLNAYNVIHPCGRNVVATNGRRIEMALRGQPLPHRTSKARAPQNKSIEIHEHQNNQFSDEEIKELVCNPAYHPAKPFEHLLETAISKVIELRQVVIKSKGLDRHNSLSQDLSAKALIRMELYLEFSHMTADEKVLKALFEKVLKRAFGPTKLSMFEIKQVEDDEDRHPTFMKWKAPQGFFSPELNGKTPWFIKLYQKNDRIRLEIQANEPNLKRSKLERLDDLLKGQSERPLRKEALAVAEIIADCLRVIEAHARKALSELPTQTNPEILFGKMLGRCSELLKNKSDSARLMSALREIAHVGYIDRKTYRAFGLNVQNLKILADPDVGFLKTQEKGLVDRQSKRKINPTYILVPEWLDRTGKPSRKPRKPKSFLVENLEHLRAYNRKQTVEDISGSALPARKPDWFD